MRFVWKIMPRDTGGALDHEQIARQAVSESREATEDPKKKQEHLKDFFKATEAFSENEKKGFYEKVEDWNRKGDKVSMRMAGVTEDENDPTKSPDGYLKRHARLSQAFVTWDKAGGKLEGKIDFRDNDTADKKVGLGDFLPPTVIAVTVTKRGGSEVQCVRVRNPRTGRIGYFQTDALEKGQYIYVAVHTGDAFKVDRTGDPNDPRIKRSIMAEHFAVYRQNAMNSDDGEELYYNDFGQPVEGTPAASYETRRERVAGHYGGQRASFQKGIAGPAAKPGEYLSSRLEATGGNFEKVGRAFWLRYFGDTPEEAGRFITREDPVYGGPLTFLGCPIPDGMNVFVIPYMKAAEEEIQAFMKSGKAEKYEVNNATATVWREVAVPGKPRVFGKEADPNKLSNHSWGVAMDVNPGSNGQGIRYENLNPQKRIPMWMVDIFKKYKFGWGGEFPIPDAMHVEFKGIPTSEDSLALLKTEKSRKYMAAAEGIAGPERLAKMKAMSAPRSAPGVAPGGAARREVAMEGGRVTPRFAPEKMKQISLGRVKATEKWVPLIEEKCKKYGIPDYAPFVRAIMMIESGGNPNARGKNRNGTVDQGLMQLNNAYFKDPDVMNPDTNVDTAVKHIAILLKRFNGNVIDVAASYNCGHAEGQKSGERRLGIPNTTKTVYVPMVLSNLSVLGWSNLPARGNYSDSTYGEGNAMA